MKYVLVLLLVAGSAFGQTRAQLKADNASLLAQAQYLAKYATELSVQIGELNKQIADLKDTQKILVDWIVKEANQPVPAPVYIRSAPLVLPPMVIETPAEPTHCTGYAHTSGDGVTISNADCY